MASYLGLFALFMLYTTHGMMDKSITVRRKVESEQKLSSLESRFTLNEIMMVIMKR